MSAKQLKEIQNYFSKKYPRSQISFWSNPDSTHYFAQILNFGRLINISCDTLGQLIKQSDDFLNENTANKN